MTYRGHVENGKIVLDEPVNLPDGAEVSIDLLNQIEIEQFHPDILKFTGIVPQDIDGEKEYRKAIIRKHQ